MDSKNQKTLSDPSINLTRPSTSSDSVLYSLIPVPVCASEQAGNSACDMEQAATSLLACDVEQAETPPSVCETDQAGNSDLTRLLEQAKNSNSTSVEKTKSHELEDSTAITDKIKSSGAIPKGGPDTPGPKKHETASRLKVQRNFNYRLKVQNNNVEKAENKTKKKEVIAGRKAKGLQNKN